MSFKVIDSKRISSNMGKQRPVSERMITDSSNSEESPSKLPKKVQEAVNDMYGLIEEDNKSVESPRLKKNKSFLSESIKSLNPFRSKKESEKPDILS